MVVRISTNNWTHAYLNADHDMERVMLCAKDSLTVTKKPVAVPQELEAMVGTI